MRDRLVVSFQRTVTHMMTLCFHLVAMLLWRPRPFRLRTRGHMEIQSSIRKIRMLYKQMPMMRLSTIHYIRLMYRPKTLRRCGLCNFNPLREVDPVALSLYHEFLADNTKRRDVGLGTDGWKEPYI
ncbi:hypothetical protein JRO89_XS08G0181300 [Xanthoceras sorbifolium]|uniref:Uncharacterized protein n=1 Tax=Xanthoceras sorbifolium TaxID=99658 RepID=A0ABQ8HQC0_9ROSI|nr:hypothetical protein JRO89_XS08G0181300 [Xanthoceras sorbifolium]